MLKVTFVIGSMEMRAHCEARAAHHLKRCSEKQQELPKLMESLDALRKRKPEDVGIRPEYIRVGGGDDMKWPDGRTATYKNDETTIEAIEKEIRNHAVKAARFTFFAQHVRNEDYQLDASELTELEFIPALAY